jgi:cystathionine gamma-synthase
MRFTPLPLGARIPDSPHAVSCSLPTMHDVRGYEERWPDVMRQVPSAYPRFVVHTYSRQLAAAFAVEDALLAGRTLWLTSSARMASRLVAHLGPTSDARILVRDGVNGVSHAPEPAMTAKAKTFLQNVGGNLSSREAEDHLVRRGILPALHPETAYPGDAPAEIRRQLRTAMPLATDADLFVANCGMNAIDAAFRAVSTTQAPRGRTAWLQLGWLYLDTIAILQKFTASPGDYLYLADVADADGLARIFAEHGPRLAGVIAEVPTNPLVQTPDVERLAALCREHGARLLLDPSMSSVFALDLLRHSDVVVSSLTKYTSSDGDILAGLVAVNPSGTDAAAIRAGVADAVEPLYVRDAARLAAEIGHTRDVLARVHASVPQVVAFLESHPAVRRVYWAMQTGDGDRYARAAGRPDAPSAVITFTLREAGALTRVYDRLRLAKGPSFGMRTTLLCPFMYLAHYDMVSTETGRRTIEASGLDPDLLRLSIGTEPVEAIIEALAEALA